MPPFLCSTAPHDAPSPQPRPIPTCLSTVGSTPSGSLSGWPPLSNLPGPTPHLHRPAHEDTRSGGGGEDLDLGRVWLGKDIPLCLSLGKGIDAAEVQLLPCRINFFVQSLLRDELGVKEFAVVFGWKTLLFAPSVLCW